MSGSLNRLGRLWIVSKHSSITGCAGTFSSIRINHSTILPFSRRRSQFEGVCQFRFVSSEGGKSANQDGKGKDGDYSEINS